MSLSDKCLPSDACERNLSTRLACGKLWSGQKAMSGPVCSKHQHTGGPVWGVRTGEELTRE